MRSLLGKAGQSLAVRRQATLARPENLSRAPRGSMISSWFRGQTLSTTGVERYGTDPTLFPIVSALAQDTAACKFHLYAPGPTRQDEDREEIFEGGHPCVDLFHKPNEFQSTAEFVEAGQQHIDLVGETTILVEYIAKVPVRLWIIPPWKLSPVKANILRTPAASKFLLGWFYTADDGEQIPLRRDEIIQIKLPNPNDPWRGLGPVQASLTFLDSSRFSAEWNRNFFINGAVPEGVIQIEEAFNDDEFREFTERWRETHQGLSNAHRVAILENGAVWVPNQMTQRDMQFNELQLLSSDFIRRAFRFPKTMLGGTDDANRAVAEAGEYTYGKWMIEPRASRWTSALNNRLLPLYGPNPRGLYWDFDPVVERDEATEADTVNTRFTAAQTAIQSGFDDQEVLATVGLPPIKWTKPEVPQPYGGTNGKPGPEPSGDAKPDSGASRRDRENREDSGKPAPRSD